MITGELERQGVAGTTAGAAQFYREGVGREREKEREREREGEREGVAEKVLQSRMKFSRGTETRHYAVTCHDKRGAG